MGRPDFKKGWTRRQLLRAASLLPLGAGVIGLGNHAFAAPSWAPFPAPAWDALKAHHGKVVLLDFWASWCVPCRRSFPWMNDLHQRQRGHGLVVIGVNVDQERALAEAFLQETPAQFQIEFDVAGQRAKQFGVQAMPTSFLIDRKGQVRHRHAGFRAAHRAPREQTIEQLLKESDT